MPSAMSSPSEPVEMPAAVPPGPPIRGELRKTGDGLRFHVCGAPESAAVPLSGRSAEIEDALKTLEVQEGGGLYLEDCQVSGTTPPPGSLGAEAWALDPEAAARLWAVSEETLGERFAWS